MVWVLGDGFDALEVGCNDDGMKVEIFVGEVVGLFV